MLKELQETARGADVWRADRQGWVDPVADALQGAPRSLVGRAEPAPRRAKDLLHGTWLGHLLHPALTDVPIGAWTVGLLLDLADAPRRGSGARRGRAADVSPEQKRAATTSAQPRSA